MSVVLPFLLRLGKSFFGIFGSPLPVPMTSLPVAHVHMITSGDVTIPIDPTQILIELSPYTTVQTCKPGDQSQNIIIYTLVNVLNIYIH
jgi:hypothetical protein